MTLRQGVVVDVHPEDHSVDLLMTDDGSRLAGVQVQSNNGTSRSGSVNLPEAPKRKNKWDPTELTENETIAFVDYVAARNPVVTGFRYPQINKMLSTDPMLEYHRSKSDVLTYDDGKGNIGILHPGGAFIAIGDSPNAYTFPNMADGAMVLDRNTDQKTYMRVSLGGQAVDIVMTPDGDLKISLNKDFTMECQQGTIKAETGLTFDTPKAHFTGDVTSDGDMTAGEISLKKHKTSGVKQGTDTSDVPVPG